MAGACLSARVLRASAGPSVIAAALSGSPPASNGGRAHPNGCLKSHGSPPPRAPIVNLLR